MTKLESACTIAQHSTAQHDSFSFLSYLNKKHGGIIGHIRTAIISSLSPRIATSLLYRIVFHKKLNLNNPQDLNQKMQYLKLKLYTDNPIITQCVDKFRVKEYLSSKGYGYMTVPVLSELYSEPEDLRKLWPSLPAKFVIKCNHGSTYNIIIRDKNTASIEEIITQLRIWLKEDYWKFYCETPYQHVAKGFFVEEYLADDMRDYKFYCFNGQPKTLQAASDGEDGKACFYVDIFDSEWNLLPVTLGKHGHKTPPPSKPENFEEMKRIAVELSKDFPFVRVDMYDVKGKIYFGEFTFVPTAGFMRLKPEGTLEEWGSWLKLPE